MVVSDKIEDYRGRWLAHVIWCREAEGRNPLFSCIPRFRGSESLVTGVAVYRESDQMRIGSSLAQREVEREGGR